MASMTQLNWRSSYLPGSRRTMDSSNKRTAWTAAVVFLEINGYEVPHQLDSNQLDEFLRRIVDRKVPTDLLANLRRRVVRPIPFR
ncbi:hypothetical protein XH94_16605 [Bradyrhizobium zhanjiangense]|uniref:Uncharacterized protein n=1 Tax=Bradyrhizobium zhanjiangense TaxID=1325107 RepID=A0A4Q0SIT2_9BRAD|nr:hypothetical protein XH94_16605 [Bradyrhizobium zhanjiangense]